MRLAKAKRAADRCKGVCSMPVDEEYAPGLWCADMRTDALYSRFTSAAVAVSGSGAGASRFSARCRERYARTLGCPHRPAKWPTQPAAEGCEIGTAGAAITRSSALQAREQHEARIVSLEAALRDILGRLGDAPVPGSSALILQVPNEDVANWRKVLDQ